jgi:hypothetical protein
MAHKTGPTTESKPGENIFVDPSYTNSTPPADQREDGAEAGQLRPGFFLRFLPHRAQQHAGRCVGANSGGDGS